MVPTWEAVLAVLRPGQNEDENPKHGWQKPAARHARTQSGTGRLAQLDGSRTSIVEISEGSCNVLMAFLASRSTRIDPQPFRVLLCRGLADLVVSSTAVATIEQRARRRWSKEICIGGQLHGRRAADQWRSVGRRSEEEGENLPRVGG